MSDDPRAVFNVTQGSEAVILEAYDGNKMRIQSTTMAVSDYLGNSRIFFFCWRGYLYVLVCSL
jgi:hypothetical protein